MQRRYNQFNTKHRIKKLVDGDLEHCSDLAEQIRYGDNPEHKMNPGDFGLTPPRVEDLENPYVIRLAYSQDKRHWSVLNWVCAKG